MLARQFGERLVVYYCIDDYAALPDVDSEAVARMDADLLRRADQVFVASSLLLEAKRQLNPSAVHAPHGVDVRLFRAASDTTRPVAEPVRELPHPIIGFYGLIEAWVDLDLIGFLAEQRPTWTFLLIGRLAVDPGPLRRLPNVVFAGAQPYKSLPDWARAFDVAIIPYRLTRQVVNAAPLKLREYLATGKPIVAVSTQEIDRFARYIRIARTREEFLTHIEAALTDDSAADRAQRMEATNDMTWEARVDAVIDVVNQRLQQKERCA
jgi:glycosyltransferase involved in cell wall biosynthesis